MDVAYDHIQEEALSPSERPPAEETDQSSTTSNNTSSSADWNAAWSPWGNRLGSWFNSARKQGESFYQDLQKEAEQAQEQATKSFSSLREQVVSRTRSLSFDAGPGPVALVPGEEALPVQVTVGAVREDGKVKDAGSAAEPEALQDNQTPESLPADIVKEAGTLVASLRLTAASKLKDLQRAEDAADEALLKFGANVRNFLRDAVTITAPPASDSESEVLFETQEAGTGKKVFHSTRIDAQLHAIHTTAGSFTSDPATEAWEGWKQEFDIDGRTEDIAKDLDKYEELRRAMEKLVPEKVEYKAFWCRYYFLRSAVESEEKRRREVLKQGATANPEEEVGWDEDSDDERTSATPHQNKAASESTTTLNAPTAGGLKPNSPRRSHEDESKSVADSDASYDIVSGATSRATGSPKEEKREVGKDEGSDDDWE